MPRLFSSQRLTAAIAATLATGAVAIVPASAETRIETVLGTVTKSDPIRTSYIRKTPSDEKVCETQEVPVYGQASAGSNNNNSDLGAMIIGGVIGSAIGNKTSDQDGAGAAGAVPNLDPVRLVAHVQPVVDLLADDRRGVDERLLQ